MKLRVERDVLAEAVTWAARAVPSKPPVPVLAGLHLVAGDGTLTVSAFDYETSTRTTVAAEVGDAGSVLVSGRLLADIVRALPGKPVDLWLDGTRLRVQCGAYKGALLTMPVDEYPSLPAFPDAAGTVAGGVFAGAVAQVAVAASRDENLPLLTGVRVEAVGSELTLMATDRYRLAVRSLPWTPVDDGIDAAALVRHRTLSEVAKALGGGDVTVGLSDALVAFEAGGRRTTSLLVDGDYPKVRALFPAEHAGYAVVDVVAVVEAVRRVALVAERNTPVRLAFEAHGTHGTLTLEAGQGEDAQAVEEVGADLCGFNGITAAFNPQYLLDGLCALTTPFARLSFTVPTKPAVITGQAEADGGDDMAFRYLIMPVRS